MKHLLIRQWHMRKKNLNTAIYVASHFIYIYTVFSFFLSLAFARLSIISKILLFEKNDMPLDEEVVVFDGSFQCLWWWKKQQLNVLYGGAIKYDGRDNINLESHKNYERKKYKTLTNMTNDFPLNLWPKNCLHVYCS